MSFTNGQVGQAFSFNGTGASIDLGNWFNLQCFSVAVWVKPRASQAMNANIIDNNHGNIPNHSWGIEYRNTGLRFEWDLFTAGGISPIPFDLAADTWQYLVLTLDTNRVARVYLNAQEQGSVTLSGPIQYDGTQFLRLGGWAVGQGRYFNGLSDEIDIYNQALSKDEVQALFNAGSVGKCRAPLITQQPHGVMGYWGGNVSVNVRADGNLPPSYLWYKDGFPILWATNSTLLLDNLAVADGGNYWAEASNSEGTITSSPSLVVVNPAGVTIGLHPFLTITGVVGRSYGIQYTPDVTQTTSWINLTNILLTQPVQEWVDTSVDSTSVNRPRRFYRVVVIP